MMQINGVGRCCGFDRGIKWERTPMSASEIATTHFSAAMAAAHAACIDQDSVCRSMLGLIVAKYLQNRSAADVQSELHFLADHSDPDTDFAFMRP
jgi:hypothetical protein